MVEAKWPGTREAFNGFSAEAVADLTPDDLDQLTMDTRVIRNRRKLEATVGNAPPNAGAGASARKLQGLSALPWRLREYSG